MYIGVMLMYCNLLTVPLTVFAIVMLHLQILQEERYLEETFGTAYREYKRHTLRYEAMGMSQGLCIKNNEEDVFAKQ